jgi:hypothetical protein
LTAEIARRQMVRDEQARLARRVEAQARLDTARRKAEEARLAAEAALRDAAAVEAELNSI